MSLFRKEQVDAANQFVTAAIGALRNEKGVHAETAVAATARMAGTFLFRSFGLKLPGTVKPGQPVLSDLANEEGPKLIGILGGVLTNVGVKLDEARLAKEPEPGHKPLLGFLETQALLEPPFARIRERLGLSLAEAAHSAAAATALMIQRTAQVLDPNVAFHVAAYGFVEGAKTAPGPA